MSELLDRLLTPRQRADVAASDAALSHYQGQAAIAELCRLNGGGLKPQPGCKLALLALGDTEAWVEYEYSPGRAGVHTLPNGDPGFPDDPAELAVLNVLVNGRMVDADLFAPAVLEQWEQAITDIEADAAAVLQDGPDADPEDDEAEADEWDAEPDEDAADRAADRYERDIDARHA